MTQLKRELILNMKNIPGRRSSRKMLAIECDDWGGSRTPSEDVYNDLVDKGLVDAHCRYRFDTLATFEDMERLYETLYSVRDAKGCPVIMTPIVNVANPDFEKIRKDGFENYYYEKFTDTLLRYGRGESVIRAWKKGIEEGIFMPELHGREHLSVQLWLQKLRDGNKDLLYAFDRGFTSIELDDMKPEARGFRAEFYFNSKSQIPFLKNSIKSGIEIFEGIFDKTPNVFVPSNAVFSPVFEKVLTDSGIKFLNVWPINSVLDVDGNMKKKFYINGKRSSSGLRYYVRNCAFEPSENGYNGYASTLKQIQAAFRWNKPAIISTHRVNFVGGINADNREFGLSELNKLMKKVVQTWPDVEFKNSYELLRLQYSEV